MSTSTSLLAIILFVLVVLFTKTYGTSVSRDVLVDESLFELTPKVSLDKICRYLTLVQSTRSQVSLNREARATGRHGDSKGDSYSTTNEIQALLPKLLDKLDVSGKGSVNDELALGAMPGWTTRFSDEINIGRWQPMRGKRDRIELELS